MSATPTVPEYMFDVAVPSVEFQCNDKATKLDPSMHWLRRAPFRLTGKPGAPGAVSNTKTFKIETTTAKVSFTMSPKSR